MEHVLEINLRFDVVKSSRLPRGQEVNIRTKESDNSPLSEPSNKFRGRREGNLYRNLKKKDYFRKVIGGDRQAPSISISITSLLVSVARSRRICRLIYRATLTFSLRALAI